MTAWLGSNTNICCVKVPLFTVSLHCHSMVFQGQFVHSDSPHPPPHSLSLDPQRHFRPWKERSGTRSSSSRSMGRCPPSNSSGRLWRTPTPTLKCSKTWASLPRPWSLLMKTCKSEHRGVIDWTGTKPLCTDYFCNFLFVTETKTSIKKIQSVLKWSEILQGGFADNEMHIISPTCSNPFFYAFILVSICKM